MSQLPISPGPGGLPWLSLEAPDGARAQVSLHGGHLTSWFPVSGGERLFLSPKADFNLHSAIRGGVPILFPQFSVFGPLRKHGFARTTTWDVRSTSVHNGLISAILTLADNETTRSEWRYPFLLELMITLGGEQLSLTLSVTNTGQEVFQFTTGLHTYLKVSDISNIQVSGLQNCVFIDQTDSNSENKETEPKLIVDGEIDRIYLNPRPVLTLQDGDTLLKIGKRGLRDTVIWNPGAIACAKLPDMEPASYRHFVCIEAVTIARPVRLSASESWQGTQLLSASQTTNQTRRTP